jgi:thiol-disulfide isomerase/thioredoxin
LPDLAGETVRLADFQGRPALVLFWNPGCGFCARMLDDLKAWETGPGADDGAPRLLVVSTGGVEANRAMGLASTVVLDEGFNTGRAFGAAGTPSAVLVDAGGNVASEVAVGAPGVLALARGEDPAAATGNGVPPAPVAKVGDPAPSLSLPNLGGEEVALGTLLRGTRTLLLFWNPGCGFCERMLDDLRAWEAKPPKGAPKLLLVSSGDAETNRAQGLRSPILLDQGFAVGRAFGATGTPSAVLVDGRGRVASEVVVGAPAVLDLAKGGRDRLQIKAATV